MTMVGGRSRLRAPPRPRANGADRAGTPAPIPARDARVERVRVARLGDAIGLGLTRDALRRPQTATLRSSLTGGSRRLCLSCRAGDSSASAFAAAMNIASVTRRAFAASTPSPTPGKMYELLVWSIGTGRAVPDDRRKRTAGADDRAAVGPRERAAPASPRSRCRIGQREDDRPLDVCRHRADDRLGEARRPGPTRRSAPSAARSLTTSIRSIRLGSRRRPAGDRARDCTKGAAPAVMIGHAVDSRPWRSTAKKLRSRLGLAMPGIDHRLAAAACRCRSRPSPRRTRTMRCSASGTPVTLIAASSVAGRDRGGALDVVVEGAQPIAIALEQAAARWRWRSPPIAAARWASARVTAATKASTKSSYSWPRTRSWRQPI